MWLICFAIKDIITVECDLKTDIKIQYDVRFDAIVPTAVHDAASQDVIRLIINVEAQTAFNPGYPLTKRAIYYCSRMILPSTGRYSKSRSTEKSEKCILYGYAQSRLRNSKTRSRGIQFGRSR